MSIDTETVVARVPQIDGSVRLVLAQDARHTEIARRIVRDDPAMLDQLNGLDGIRIEIRDVRP